MIRNNHVEIIEILREATLATTGGSPETRLRASLIWVDVAIGWSDPSALEAYRVALELLETVLASGRSMESRHQRITSARTRKTDNLAVDGAALALDSGEIEMAVELLEQGRSILLTQAGKYRTRVDDLRAINPSLADEFVSTSEMMKNSVMPSGNDEFETPSLMGFDDTVAR